MHFPRPVESVYLDLSDRAKLRLTGADRVRFLNGQVSNDVRNASAERSVYTGVMTIKGKLCADAFIHAGGDFLLVDTEPELREALAARLERYIIADDVQIEDVTDAFALLHLIDFAADTGAPKLPDLRAALAALGPGWWTVESARYGRPGLDVFLRTGARRQDPPLPAPRLHGTQRRRGGSLADRSPECRAGGRNSTRTRCPPKPASKNAP